MDLIIDSVYHFNELKVLSHRLNQNLPDETEIPWNTDTSPALKELLEHVAQELAEEYLHLMKSGGED